MIGYLAISILFFSLICRVVIWPVTVYFRDAKGLRKYPNLTWSSGFSNLSYMILSTTGKRSAHLAKLHQKHPIIRVGPNALSFGNHQAIAGIYGHSSKCSKDEFYSVVAGTHFHLADVIDKVHHAQKRKVLSSAYALKNIETWESKIAGKIRLVVKHFDAACTAAPTSLDRIEPSDLKVDYRAWTNFFTMDAIAEIGLSQTLGFTEKGDDQIISEQLDGTKRLVGFRESLHSQLLAQSHIVWSYEFYPLLAKITNLIPFYRKLWRLGQSYDGIVYHQAKLRYTRYQKGEKLDDFFQALMETKDGKIHALEWGEIVAEISIMLNAGSVSTAIAINYVMYRLLQNPEILARLRDELDDALGEDDEVASFEQIKHLPYLRACIDEAMRMNPPTPFNLPRRTPSDGATIMGEFIPGDTTVGMSSYAAHRDTSIWRDPESFRPERWLGQEGKDLQPFFLTFSAGARGCIGRNISYLEQSMITATMVHRYNFALPSPKWEQERYEHFSDNAFELPLKVWRRDRKSNNPVRATARAHDS